MEQPTFESLTARQKECLRLVARDRDAKEIARILEISPGTVVVHLKAAMRTLGVNSRFVAGRMLAEHEGRIHPVVSPPMGIEPNAKTDTKEASCQPERVSVTGGTVREDRTRFDPQRPEPPASYPVEQRETRNDLGSLAKLALIGAIAISLAALAIAAVPMSQSFQHLANAIDSIIH